MMVKGCDVFCIVLILEEEFNIKIKDNIILKVYR